MSRLPAGGSRSERTTPQPSPTQPYPGMQPPIPRTSPREPPMNHPVLPPLRQLSSTPPTPSGQRYADPFRQILNPQQELREQERNRRRSASQMDSPSPVETSHSQSLPSISRPNSAELTQDEHMPRPFHPPGRPGARHILDTKSPRLHRTQSLNLLNPPTGTIDAHQSPFLTASTRPSEPASSHQSLPTPPAAGRHSYFPAMPTTGAAPPHSMARTDLRRPSMGFPQSGSASPIAQYSPYSQPGSVASSQFDTPSTPGHYPNRQPSVQMHESRLSAGPMEAERNMIPMAPSSQSSIQLMTIKSQHGHNVQIPVDVQAASKVADEKRRRNAGASARFRARRKEKEREASMSISRLEQQLRNALEDAEFYHSERDYFKAIVFSQSRPETLSVTRPQSPRLRRPSIPPSNATSSIRGGSEDSFADYEEEIREEERNVRRRTSNYHPASGPPPNDISAPDARSQNYPPGYPPGNQLSQGVSPVHQYPAREQMHPGQPVYRDQYGQDKGRYENSNWTPPQGQPRET
ncbi:hypothetical protein HBH56_139990 [Parastagonospora nodorum]|uniref:BZIP domain-containing protein n=2 Tax=Phaeosphaeria nodorum (strain SN15 / ATCC MYA-4574 / FGSC 10173) TaxID=321614 RepID=A0A7U2ERV9_PHANO|nr:hypothetical protein HBH56_139990 [Parastagonospora nodorum]QRC91522.1 hypothetical protein JI435_010260 [Parastagonospora nodorum SN15]KAH3928017.1 hypothetical protein HBH54_145130 [Parastagonospora nodorum]KAH3949144.1 hypothetical protein HBH53_095130 [Parastagonospora nodorum]KAH4041555.1 hypothetical protein HBI09_001420 [Parastagonospora nodorum]